MTNTAAASGKNFIVVARWGKMSDINLFTRRKSHWSIIFYIFVISSSPYTPVLHRMIWFCSLLLLVAFCWMMQLWMKTLSGIYVLCLAHEVSAIKKFFNFKRNLLQIRKKSILQNLSKKLWLALTFFLNKSLREKCVRDQEVFINHHKKCALDGGRRDDF